MVVSLLLSKGLSKPGCGAERVDLVGKYTTRPSQEAEATFTTKVFESEGSMDVSSKPGDVYFESHLGAYYNYAKSVGGSSESSSDGFKVEISTGNETQSVDSGDRTRTVSGKEQVDITGTYTETLSIGLSQLMNILSNTEGTFTFILRNGEMVTYTDWNDIPEDLNLKHVICFKPIIPQTHIPFPNIKRLKSGTVD